MYFRYLARELLRRRRQAVVIALGLGVGIGLVITVSAVSAGVRAAQGKVLHSLYGVGTDMTVTKTVSAPRSGTQHFGGFPGFGSRSRTRPPAGTHISRNRLRVDFSAPTFSQSYVSRVASTKGVAAATGGLMLADTSFSGTIPNFPAGGSSAAGGSSKGPSFNISSFKVDGVQPSRAGVGPLDSSEITKGSLFTPAEDDADVAVVSSTYAASHSLGVGSSVDVAGKKMSIVGVASLPSSSADVVYLPLGTAQRLSGLKNDVNIVYVSAASASGVSSLASTIHKEVPHSTVTTSASLAKEVSGSLSSTSSLTNNLGKWLSLAALLVAFVVAALLMAAAVSRRVRELGTLKAIGWRTRRIVGQVTGEGAALGVVGAAAGAVLGVVGAAVVSAVSPSLRAIVGSTFSTGGGPSFFGGGAGSGLPGGRFPGPTRAGLAATAHSVAVHLTAPVQGGTILLAIGLAVAGGLLAGGFGAWRAARLRPAEALRRIE